MCVCGCVVYVHVLYMYYSTPPPPPPHVHTHSMQKDKSVSMDTEIESYKKAVLKEQERSEQLTGMLRKLEADIAHVKKQIETSQSRREQLKMEYMVYTRTLQETEQALNKATTVRGCTHQHNSCAAVFCYVCTHMYVCGFVAAVLLYAYIMHS